MHARKVLRDCKAIVLGLLILCFLHMVSSASKRQFNLDRFCKRQCARGRGGNLCKCNAVHFAGKRATEENIELNYGGYKIYPEIRKSVLENILKSLPNMQDKDMESALEKNIKNAQQLKSRTTEYSKKSSEAENKVNNSLQKSVDLINNTSPNRTGSSRTSRRSLLLRNLIQVIRESFYVKKNYSSRVTESLPLAM